MIQDISRVPGEASKQTAGRDEGRDGGLKGDTAR